MKVLIINTVNTDPNGIAQVIFNINDYIDHSDLIMDLVSINTPKYIFYQRFEKYNGHIYVLNRSVKNLFNYIYKLYKLIKKNQYDIIHVHGNSSKICIDLFAAYIAGCKVRISHSHNTTCNAQILHFLLLPIFNLLVTDRFACGLEAGKWLYNKKEFNIIKNGIDTSKYTFNKVIRNQIRKELNISENQILLGHVGFFNKQKNQLFLLQCFHEILKLNPQYKLILIGDGPDHNVITKRIEELHLKSHIILTGLINNVNEYINAIDIIIMPSLYEGLPLSMIEEQANGLYCIVSDSITKEADITGNVKYLPLQQGPLLWANTIYKIQPFTHNRELTSKEAIEKISNAGYNINDEAKKVLIYYKKAVKKSILK